MNKFLILTLSLWVHFGIIAQSSLEMQLYELPDVIFNKMDTPEGFQSAYELKIKQPIDHNDFSKGYFYQRVFLSHKSFESPTIMITNGYGRPSNNINEIVQLLDANQLNIEHRYFLESSPETKDYSYLTFEQVTADIHKINQLFKQIYTGKWLASGISKGGTTCIFYRYFYPDDVDVSIPYVAPVNLSIEDQRLYDFLDNIGTEECRKAIYNYQLRMLENAEDIKSYLKWFAQGQDLKFNYLSFDEAYEYSVLELPFSFWQYGHDCTLIPDENADKDDHMQYLMDLVGLQFFSDEAMEGYASHYYQSGTQMGYYGYDIDDFKGMIKYLPTDHNPSAVFMPNKMKANFDGTLTKKVFDWTYTANHMVYINGALDTWSATAAPKAASNNSLYYFLEGKHHATARIANMSQEERDLLIQTLEEWLDLSITDIFQD